MSKPPSDQPRSLANGKVTTSVSEATAKDVDTAVDAAQKAFDTVWGLNAPGAQRSILLGKLARLLEEHADELAALEALDNGAVTAWMYICPSVLSQDALRRENIQLGQECRCGRCHRLHTLLCWLGR